MYVLLLLVWRLFLSVWVCVRLLLSFSSLCTIFGRRISTDQAKEWIKQLETRDVPVIVCLTFADVLYSQFISEDKGNPQPTESKQRKIKRELEVRVY